MIFNGAPSFVASMQKDTGFGQIIEFQPDDDRTVKCASTGFPASSGCWAAIGDSESTAKEVETKDPSGRKVLLKVWYDESKGELISKGYNVADKFYSNQYRKINEDGTLSLTITNIKEDNSQCSFDARFKKLM